MTNFNVKVDGLGDVLKMFDQVGGKQAQADVNKITETYARKMASEAADNAPVKTGGLKNSLASSPQQSNEPHTWQWGSDKPYATRQEYEHKTKKAFVRRAIWNNENDYVDAVKRRLTKG
jgi:hypothetical protein